MPNLSELTIGRTNGNERWFWETRPFSRALAGILFAALFLVLFHIPVPVFSRPIPRSYSVTLAWDRSPSPEVTTYRLYYGGASGTYTNSADVGNVTTNTVPGLASGVTYFFAVTAVGEAGLESDFSNEVSYTPGKPQVSALAAPAGQVVLAVNGLIGCTYDILATQSFTEWTVIGTVTLGAGEVQNFADTNAANFPKRFYCIRLRP